MSINLIEGEVLLARIKMTRKIWVLEGILILFCLLLSIGIENNAQGVILAYIIFGIIITVFFSTLWAIRYDGYITNKRIIRHHGIIKKIHEMELELLEAVEIKRAGVLFWHNITFRGRNGVQMNFDIVSNPEELKEAFYKGRGEIKKSSLTNNASRYTDGSI